MTVVAVLLAVALIIIVTGAWYERHRVELDRRAERNQWTTALLARTSSEFAEAQRTIDHQAGTGVRERMARRRRDLDTDDDGPVIPIGL